MFVVTFSKSIRSSRERLSFHVKIQIVFEAMCKPKAVQDSAQLLLNPLSRAGLSDDQERVQFNSLNQRCPR